MDPGHTDDGIASFFDEESNNIFIKLAKEFEKDEDYLLPIITTPMSSPSIENLDNLDFLQDLQESEITSKQPKVVEAMAMKTMTVPNYCGGREETGSFQQSCFPIGSGGVGSSQVLKQMDEATKIIYKKMKNRESAARSRSRKKAYDLQMKLEIKNLKEEIQFENKVLAFLSNQNTRTSGGRNGLKRTFSALI